MKAFRLMILVVGLALAMPCLQVRAASPEIVVYVDNVIVNGVSAQKQLVTTYSNGPSRSLPVSIRNTGNANLVINNWVVPSGFSAPVGAQVSIAPGKSFNFSISQSLSPTGVKSGLFKFSSNDSDERLISLNLRGKVLPPITASSPFDRAASTSSYTIYESRAGTVYSIDPSFGPTPSNGVFVITNNRGFRWTFDGSLTTVVLHGGSGVTIEDWTPGYTWTPITIIRK